MDIPLIVTIGDVMLDEYKWCSSKFNPEHEKAPCLLVEKTDYRPGGAGNVAINIANLGNTSHLISVVGNDDGAQQLKSAIKHEHLRHTLIHDSSRPTILKTRYLLSHDQYVLRADEERKHPLAANHTHEMVKAASGGTAIIISDYCKGVVGPHLIEGLRTHHVPIYANGKPEHISCYRGLELLTFNLVETAAIIKDAKRQIAIPLLAQSLQSNILVTLGKNGMEYYGVDGSHYAVQGIPVHSKDQTGAGDTVIATFVHFHVRKTPVEQCLQLANRAGAISVQHIGCYHVTAQEILDWKPV